MISGIFILASCTKDAGMRPSYSEDIQAPLKEEISFYLDDAADTKADIITVPSSFNVLCFTGTAGSDEMTVFNSVFSKTGSYYQGGKYWPSSDRRYNFYASNADITASRSGAYITVSEATDIIVAHYGYRSNYESFERIIPLQFNHIYAKLGYCNVTAPEGYTVTDLKVSFSPYYLGVYDLNGVWTGKTKRNITLATSLNSSSSLGSYIVPGKYTVTLTYTLNKNGYVEPVNKSVDLEFISGKTNNLLLRLPSGNDVEGPEGGIDVDDWESGGNIKEGM